MVLLDGILVFHQIHGNIFIYLCFFFRYIQTSHIIHRIFPFYRRRMVRLEQSRRAAYQGRQQHDSHHRRNWTANGRFICQSLVFRGMPGSCLCAQRTFGPHHVAHRSRGGHFHRHPILLYSKGIEAVGTFLQPGRCPRHRGAGRHQNGGISLCRAMGNYDVW